MRGVHMRTPRRVWPPPVLGDVAPPELALGADLFRRITWPHNPRFADVRRIWAQTQLVVWSTPALQLAGRVLEAAAPVSDAAARTARHIGDAVDATRYPLDPAILHMLPTPECWWVGDGGFIGMRIKNAHGIAEDAAVTALALYAAPSGVLLTPIVGTQPWMAAFWPVGHTRARVLADWARQGRPADTYFADVFSVLTLAIHAGLLARLGGLVETVDVQSGELTARWSCLRGELPTADPRVKPS